MPANKQWKAPQLKSGVEMAIQVKGGNGNSLMALWCACCKQGCGWGVGLMQANWLVASRVARSCGKQETCKPATGSCGASPPFQHPAKGWFVVSNTMPFRKQRAHVLPASAVTPCECQDSSAPQKPMQPSLQQPALALTRGAWGKHSRRLCCLNFCMPSGSEQGPHVKPLLKA